LATLLVTACSGSRGDVTGLPWPEDELYSLVVRTDFTDDVAWSRVRSQIETPPPFLQQAGMSHTPVAFVDDRRWDQLTVDDLVQLAKAAPNHPVAFLVDHVTLTDPEHPVLAVDLDQEPGRTFRVIPSSIWDVQANLSIANAGWEDYVVQLDSDGVYRGFPQP
jgi:hypothetical protein